MPRLDWIPNKLKAPQHLFDTQRDWWRNIVNAMFENDLMQGYLPKTADLCLLAGARTRAFWNAKCAAVLACFESATIGSQEVIFYRPLLDLITAQRGKLRGSKGARESPSNSLSQSVFDFEVQKQNQSKSVREARAKPAASEKLIERAEKDRRTQLTEATRRGLRDYKKHPTEPWEREASA